MRRFLAICVVIAFLVTGCANFRTNWNEFIGRVCENYEANSAQIDTSIKTLQQILDLLVVGWPTDPTQVQEFVFAAQLVISGLTQVLALAAKTCPTDSDAAEAEAVATKITRDTTVTKVATWAKQNAARKRK